MEAASRFVAVDGLRLHYLEQGEGSPVLLVHGWPTSSFLWRGVIPRVAARSRVIALDLPGFGLSDKPVDASYSFRFFERVLEGFLAALAIDEVSLAVHDLGGPIGLYWAVRHPERLRKLAILNTIVYPELSWQVVAFVVGCRLPIARSVLASRWGLKKAIEVGIHDRSRLSEEAIRRYQEPFDSDAARKALLRAGFGLHPKGMEEIAERLPKLEVPVRVVYAERDRILGDVAKTMRRVAKDLPRAVVTSIPGCGHFLQEERPDEVGAILAQFFD